MTFSKADDEMYVGWSGDGKEICDIFAKHLIDTEWDGEKNARILITNYKYSYAV